MSPLGFPLPGALTPAGLGISTLIPLIQAGFVDWIISTGANLYHDTHFGIGLSMHQGNAQISDIVLREEEVVRIYDIFFDYSVLLDTDAFFRQIIDAEEFQKTDVHRRVSLSLRTLRSRARTKTRNRKQVVTGGGVRIRSANLHIVSRRFLDRHERRGKGFAGKQTRIRSFARRKRNGSDCACRKARSDS